MILSSYLSNNYARDVPVTMSASIAFEQSYGGVDGDSASSTELYALLSSLSGIPINQGLAVTGSVNQFGEVQVIGGANEKIEGFFDICSGRSGGLTGEQGVLLPAGNVKNLMLRPDIVAACKAGDFHIYSISHIDEGIEVLTGVAAGKRHAKTSVFPDGSINRLVEDQLVEFALMRRSFGRGKPDNSTKNGTDSDQLDQSDPGASDVKGNTSSKTTSKKKGKTKRASKKKGNTGRKPTRIS